MIWLFKVCQDKNRGLLVQSIITPDKNEFYFKHQDQPLHRHCEQLQNIVKAANVLRAKNIEIDVSSFAYHYFSNGTIMFRGIKLNSVTDQMDKVFTAKLNKKIGAMKRKETFAANKQTKIEEKNRQFALKMEAAERNYQAERVKRIAEIGKPQVQKTKAPIIANVIPSPRGRIVQGNDQASGQVNNQAISSLFGGRQRQGIGGLEYMLGRGQGIGGQGYMLGRGQGIGGQGYMLGQGQVIGGQGYMGQGNGQASGQSGQGNNQTIASLFGHVRQVQGIGGHGQGYLLGNDMSQITPLEDLTDLPDYDDIEMGD